MEIQAVFEVLKKDPLFSYIFLELIVDSNNNI